MHKNRKSDEVHSSDFDSFDSDIQSREYREVAGLLLRRNYFFFLFLVDVMTKPFFVEKVREGFRTKLGLKVSTFVKKPGGHVELT